MSINKQLYLLLCVVLLYATQIHSFFPFWSAPRPPAPSTSFRVNSANGQDAAGQTPQPRTITIMLDPAGHAQNTGRQIDDTLERSVTLQLAQALKEKLELHNEGVQVVLTRGAGQTIQPLQNANFANRLNADLFISINFYHETQTKPRLYLYNFSYNDDYLAKPAKLSFCAYDKAHLFSYGTTQQWGAIMQEVLQGDSYKSSFDCVGLYKLPFKSLIGIKCPAIALEAGLTNKDAWGVYVQPMAAALQQIIEKIPG